MGDIEMARPFVWTPAKEQVLDWTLAGGMTQAQMATRLGVTRRMIEGWTRRKAYRERYKAAADARRAQWDAEWKARIQRQAEAMRAESEAAAAADLAAIRAKYAQWAKA